jgi:hypothetical protein
VSGLVLGLGMALAASVALNAGFLLQHAGSARAPGISARRPVASLRGLLASPLWLAGLALGPAGGAGPAPRGGGGGGPGGGGGGPLHVDALAHAPLSLVQAFVAGGLVLAVPLATGLIGLRLDRRERRAVVVLALAVVLLCTGIRANPHAAVPAAGLAAWLAGAGALAGGLAAAAPRLGSGALGAAGGALYGAADLAIKALTHAHGAAAVATSPWLGVAAVATAGAFFCFQRALQVGPAVPAIALMTAATNVVSILGGLAVLGDPLGRGPALAGLHAAAFALVVAAAWRLAPVQASLQAPAALSPGASPPARP